MFSWHHVRLYACIALMVGVLVAGGWSRLTWVVPREPYGVIPLPIKPLGSPGWRRTPNVLHELRCYDTIRRTWRTYRP